MEFSKNNLIEYFNYDLEKLLDEFNNYYVLKSAKIPLQYQVLFLYFSHLAENSLQLLIDIKYNIKYATAIINIPSIYIKPYSRQEINHFLQKMGVNPKQFYGLTGFSLYFFEIFLQYIRYNDEKELLVILKNIPVIEKNLRTIYKII